MLVETAAAGEQFLVHHYPWSDVARHQLQREIIREYLHLAELIGRSDLPPDVRSVGVGEVAGLVNAAANLDPINEDLAQRAIRARAEAGDADGVRSRLRILRAALEEIDQEPTCATLALTANITIARRPGGVLPAGPGASRS